ncbi:MAG: DNA gyrase subunit A, partial [Clostridia bacterium]|nr:DNA gyrase subunit A [Clostridia bacterium]
QAQAIVEMRLRQLTGLEREKLQSEFDELMKLIAEYKAILGDRKLLLGVIKKEILEIADKYGDDRRTEIGFDEEDLTNEDLIPNENVIITATRLGYIKRMTPDNFRSQNRGGRGVKGMQTIDNDYVADMFMTMSHDTLLMFTSLGRVYRLKGYEIPEASRTARGTAIVNLLQLQSGEKVTAMIPMPRELEGKYLMMATRDGLIKKTPLDEFANLRKSGLIAIILRDEDELVSVELTDGESELLMGTRYGRAIRFNERTVRSMGRASMGVRSMRLRADDRVISMCRVDEGALVLSITENGYGKRTSPEEYRETNRGGQGVIAMNLTEKTGLLSAQLMVQEGEDIILITDEGTVIRTGVDSIRVCGRATQGVRLMRVDEGARIVGVARTDKEEADEAPTEPVSEE